MALRTIWNRICQFGCSCPACNTKPAAHQHGRTAWGYLRRPPITSTILYTTIFGYATTIDGHIKKERREQWDEVLSQKRKEVEEAEKALAETTQRIFKTQFASSSSSLDLPDLGTMPKSGEIKFPFHDKESSRLRQATMTTAVIRSPESRQRTESYLTERDKVAQDTMFKLVKYGIDRRKLSYRPSSLNDPPQATYASSSRKQLATQAWTDKKTYTMEVCIARLVLEICRASGLVHLEPLACKGLPATLLPYALLSPQNAELCLQSMEHELCDIRFRKANQDDQIPVNTSFAVPLPHYSPEVSTGSRTLLHELTGMCDRSSDAPLPDICHSLLASTGRPDITVMNLLLLKFAQLDNPHLFKATLSAILDTKIRPNEVTDALILQFYTQQNDQQRFNDYLIIMNGHPTGSLAKPWFKTFDNLHVSQGRCCVVNGKLVQAVAPSPTSFLQIINGLLHFIGLRNTMKYIQTFLSKGWQYDHTCIYTLLFSSIVEGAADLCDMLWSEAHSLAIKGSCIPTSLYALFIIAQRTFTNSNGLNIVLKSFRRDHPTHDITPCIQKRAYLLQEVRKDKIPEREENAARFFASLEQAERFFDIPRAQRNKQSSDSKNDDDTKPAISPAPAVDTEHSNSPRKPISTSTPLRMAKPSENIQEKKQARYEGRDITRAHQRRKQELDHQDSNKGVEHVEAGVEDIIEHSRDNHDSERQCEDDFHPLITAAYKSQKAGFERNAYSRLTVSIAAG